MVWRNHHKAAHARAAPFRANHFAHLRVMRGATEVALMVAALVLIGVLMARPEQPSTDGCVRMGRAGEMCGRAEAPRPSENDHCVFLGRAGRYCPSPQR
jgi:hypothetical protein